MRKIVLLGMALVMLLALSVTATASAAGNAGARASGSVKPPKAKRYQYCESGGCPSGVEVLIYAKTKHWEIPGYEPFGSYHKSGPLWIFVFESSFNNGCEFEMKKVKLNYVGKAKSNCNAPGVSEEFRAL